MLLPRTHFGWAFEDMRAVTAGAVASMIHGFSIDPLWVDQRGAPRSGGFSLETMQLVRDEYGA